MALGLVALWPYGHMALNCMYKANELGNISGNLMCLNSRDCLGLVDPQTVEHWAVLI